MGSPTDRHDPDACLEGDGCQPCKTEGQRRHLVELAERAKKHRPTASQKRTALGIAIKQATITGLAAFVALLPACAPVDLAVENARTQAMACATNATNPKLPPQVRHYEAVNFTCWDSQVFTLEGTHVSPEVSAQVAESEASIAAEGSR